MELFGAVKDAVTTRQAAEFYGIDVKSNGMARCIFHNDHSPSMKLDKRYHCFGCHADGDVINFVAGLFGLGNKEAAEKIANDFGISYEKWKPPGKPPSGREKQEKRKSGITGITRKTRSAESGRPGLRKRNRSFTGS